MDPNQDSGQKWTQRLTFLKAAAFTHRRWMDFIDTLLPSSGVGRITQTIIPSVHSAESEAFNTFIHTTAQKQILGHKLTNICGSS